jgi:transposase
VRLIDQLSLTFEELEANATEDELAAEAAVARTTHVAAFARKRPERHTFPEHLPRERVVIDPPTACECCGGVRLRKLGEDVTRTLESEPRRWKIIETVREKFTCRDCEKISQAPAPFHAVARAWAAPSLLAMIVFEKFGQHQPLNRQAERYALEGVPMALSTMADAVGSVCAALDPLLRLVEGHVHGGRAPAWRRHDRAGFGRGKDRYRAMLDLRSRRQALWRSGTAGGDVLLLTRSTRRASASPSGGIFRHPASGRL